MAAPARPLASLSTLADNTERYRLHVVARNIEELVTSIGGLIFDHAMAGWDVTVALDRDSRGLRDDRPIRILGGRVAAQPSRPRVLAIATDVFVANEHLRRLALAAQRGRASDVLLWGRWHPPRLNRRFVPARHRPSHAARVFKAHASCGGRAAESGEETFFAMC